MSNFKDKEPELPSYLNKDFDDSTKRIEVIKESTQKVEVIKEELKMTNGESGETQVIGTITDEMLNNNVSKEVVENKENLVEVKEEKKVSNEIKKENFNETKNETVESKKNKKKKEKKPLTLKKIILKRIIFLILFALIVVGLTVFLASKNNPEVKEKIEEITNTIIKPEEESREEVAEKIVDINGTYYINPIEITKYEMDVLGKKVEYVQIDGLKDEAIEDKINIDIRERISKSATELFNSHVVTNYFSGCSVEGNFANIISINFYLEVGVNNWQEYYSDNVCLNYNLIDGNEITIHDVFSSKLKLENILVDELYESFVKQYATEFDENTGNSYLPKDTEDIEEEVYAVVSDYQRGKPIDFCITPQKVVIKTNSWATATIMYSDYIDYVIIYDKYMSQTDIYDGQYTAQTALPNLTDLSYWGDINEFVDKEGSNYYINAVLFSSSYDYIPESVLNSVTTMFNDYVREKEVVDSVNRKDGMFRLYNVKFELNFWEGVYYLRIEDLTHDTTKSKYTSVLKDAIKGFFRGDKTHLPYAVSNLYLNELNYYETIIVDGKQEYEYHELIPYEEVNYDYATAEFDSIGNMYRMDGAEVILEIID